MRYLGLDLGSRTLGVAVSDTTGTIASNYGVIRHKEDYASLVAQIANIIQEKKVEKIVLGFPKNMNNTIGPKAKLSYRFQKMLQEALNIPVVLMDERLSTKQATDLLIMNDTSRKKRKSVVDGMAATIILQSYLDQIEKEK